MNYFLIKRLLTKNNLRSEKLISDLHKFIYLSVPKAATRSIIASLYRDNPEKYGTRKKTKISYNRIKNKYKDYFKFSFVRNPWARAVSCYLDKIKNPKPDAVNEIISPYRGLISGMKFENFVSFLLSREGRDSVADRHWLSQYKFISGRNGQLLVDFAGKLENMDKDWPEVCERTGIEPVRIPHLNSRYGWKINEEEIKKEDPFYYRDFYNKKTKELIQQRYQKDIEIFNYIF